MCAYPSTSLQNTKHYRHMSSPKTDFRSRKRSFEHRECDDCDGDVQVVAIKKRKTKYNQGVLSTGYVSKGLDKLRSWFKDSTLNNFARCVLSALNIQAMTDSSDSSDSENSMPFDRDNASSHDGCHRHSRRQREFDLHGEFSAAFPREADSFVKMGHGHGKHTRTAKIAPQVHKIEVEIEVSNSRSAVSKPKWPSDLKSSSKSLSRQQIHPNKGSRPEIVDLTDVNGQELPRSSSNKIPKTTDDEPEVVDMISSRKPSYLTPDIQFVRSVRSFPRPPCLKEWSNGERIAPVKLFSQSFDSRQLLKPYSSRQNGSSLSRCNSFTTSEVIRIQEKEQYKVLLEQFSYGDHYKPEAKLEIRHAETQVSAEKDIDPAFRKEILSLFPSTAYHKGNNKPCQLVKQSEYLKEKPKKKLEAPEEVVLDDEDDDDEPLVLEVKRTPSRPFPRESKLFSDEWLQELKKTVAEETEERRKLVAEQQKQIEEYKAKRAEKLAERQRLQKLKLSKAVLPEGIDAEKERLPEITPEMDAVIEKVLKITNPDEPLAQLNGIQVLRKDLDTLCGLNWLNDEIINFYIDLIVERSKQTGFPSVYAFNSFFYTSLRQKGYSAVKRWTRKVDIFSYDIILVPLHLGIHWCLGTIDFRQKKVQYFDSMLGKESCLEALRDYLLSESMDKKKKEFDLTGWSLERRTDIPPQLNGSDCGMFTLKYAEYISRDARISFTQENMPYFRRRMVYEIITKTIIY